MQRAGRTFFFVTLLVVRFAGDAHAQTWTNLGPQGGGLGTIVAAPSQPSVIYAAGVQEGLFKTSDGGDSWRSISAGLSDLYVRAIAVDPTNPNRIYVSTLADGICRSTDGGLTWTSMNSGLPTDANGYIKTITPIEVDPAVPATLNAGGLGLFHSTDSGATWTSSNAEVRGVESIVAAPSLPMTVYASGEDANFNAAIIKSTDRGASWTIVNTTIGRVGTISVDPANPNTAYLTADTVYKTIDGGVTWTPSGTGLGTGNSNVAPIVFDPVHPGALFTFARGGSGLSRSTDGGLSWVQIISTGLPPWNGSSQVLWTMAIDPVSGTLEAAAPQQGFYRSADGGVTWTAASTGLNAHPVSGLTLTADAPAAAVFSTDIVDPAGANIWKVPGGLVSISSIPSPIAGAMTSMAVDPHDPNTIYALGGFPCHVYKTTTGGSTWTKVDPAGVSIGAGVCGSTIVTDPATSGIVYLTLAYATFGSGSRLYRSTNGGASWTVASGLPDASGLEGGLSAVAVSRLHSNVLYISAAAKVYKSSSAGASWAEASTGLPSGTGTFTGRIAIDPTNDNVAYVATSAGVFGTVNGGSTWTAKTATWPAPLGHIASAVAIAVDSITPATLYASTGSPIASGFTGIDANALGNGLYKSTDTGATWALVPETNGYIVSNFVIDGHDAGFAETNNGLLRLNLTPASLSIDKGSLVFGATTTGPIATGLVSKTPAQTVRLTQAGVGSVTWTATSHQTWLSVSPSSGSGSAVLSISVNFVSGIASAQDGFITISATGATNAVGPINVRLNTIASAASGGPMGVFDTPADLTSGVTGSIALTGWALDDVAVTRVRIVREPIAGEPAGLIFIGNAVQVDGARPDVVTAFPNMPRNTMAGWGYLLLSNFLPNQGNGKFKLHALADDADGHSTDLGGKTISCSNATALKPFGAIDTPGQGDVVSGTVPNFGWTLIRSGAGVSPRADIPGGGSVTVFVDGVAVGSPIGWTNRADLTSLFPSGYSNLTSTLAVYNLDTTTLTNGVHTIFWSVIATNGQSDGIGSRFFTVSNGAAEVSASVGAAPHVDPGSMRASTEPLSGRRGFDLSTPYRSYYPDGDATIVVQAEELDRVELLVGATTGWLHTARGLEPLPIGSHLDPAGTFTWAPGVGYIGAYDFVFVRETERMDVRIVLNPKGSARVGPQVVIDAPSQDARVLGRFLIGGWAADLDAASGTGISTVHVWAYPVSGADPIFLGVADTGSRSDVAAVYGDQFRDSGYGLIVDDLPPGAYDLAVFGWSTAKRGFLPAKVVRITVR